MIDEEKRLQREPMAFGLLDDDPHGLTSPNSSRNTSIAYVPLPDDADDPTIDFTSRTHEASAHAEVVSQDDLVEGPPSLAESQKPKRTYEDLMTLVAKLHPEWYMIVPQNNTQLISEPVPGAEIPEPGYFQPPCQLGTQGRFFAIPRLFKICPNPTVISNVMSDHMKMFELGRKLNMPSDVSEQLVMSLWGVPLAEHLQVTGVSNVSVGRDAENRTNTFQLIVPSLKCAVVGLVCGQGEFGNDISSYVSKYLPGCLLNKMNKPDGGEQYVLTTVKIREAFAAVKAQMIADLKMHTKPDSSVIRCPFLASYATCSVVVATTTEVVAIQLGTKTSAYHISAERVLPLPIGQGRGSFSIVPRAPCTPEVLRVPVDENRVYGFDDIDMVLLGNSCFWERFPEPAMREIVKSHSLEGSGLCRRLNKTMIDEYKAGGEHLKPIKVVSCASVNLAMI